MMKKRILIILFIGFNFFVCAQDLVFNYLPAGSHKVGLKIIQTYDYSRTFGIINTEDGVSKNNARPIQILIWYPSSDDGDRICYSDYIITGFSEVDFTNYSNKQKLEFINRHKRVFQKNGADSTSINSILNRSCYARVNAQSIDGNFPLIVYAPGGNERCYENFILAEYIASHGYIVAAIALTGEDSQLMAFEPTDYELSVDDISFVISYMHNYKSVDNSKIGLIGFCWGSMINTIVANRNGNVDVIIDLFGAIGIKSTRNDVDKSRYHYLKNPKLAYIQFAGTSDERDSYFFENYLYGDVYQGRFDNVSHGAFTSNYVVRNHYYKGKLPSGHGISYVDTVDNCYKITCKYSLEMLDAYLKSDSSAMQFLNNKPIVNGLEGFTYYSRKAEQLPPTPNQFMMIAKSEGFQKAKQIYNDVRSKDKYWRLFQENPMISLGYQLFTSEKIDAAIEVFTMILQDYPNSWNAYDSLGEAWLKKGDKVQAKKFLEKSIELLPQNTHAKELLKQL